MSPVKITKTDGKYKVTTPNGVKAKGTTLAKAKKQERLLNAVEHGWKPTGKPAKKSNPNDHRKENEQERKKMMAYKSKKK